MNQKILVLALVVLSLLISCGKDDTTGPKDTKPTPPRVSGISPDTLYVGDILTIYGSDFGASQDSSYVSFAGTQATEYTSWSDTVIKVKAPEGAKSGKLWVVAEVEKSNEVDFTIKIQELETVTIGSQVWMKKNLDVDTYKNDDPIRHAQTDAEWIDANFKREGAWCYYNNSDSLGKIYGKLYNWYAVNDPRGLAPEGWHAPTDDEWKELEMCLGMSQADADKEYERRGTDEGGKLKSTGTIEGGDGLWHSPNEGATNSSGFSALPGGYRYYAGTFTNIGNYGFWWSSSESSATHAWFRYLYYGNVDVSRHNSTKDWGFSVRCVKD